MLKDEGYLELRDQWVPFDAHVCSEVWLEEHAAIVLVYIDFEEGVCRTLRFFTIGSNWNVSVDLTVPVTAPRG